MRKPYYFTVSILQLHFVSVTSINDRQRSTARTRLPSASGGSWRHVTLILLRLVSRSYFATPENRISSPRLRNTPDPGIHNFLKDCQSCTIMSLITSTH